ncbi:head-tail connector protein [Paracoccus methylarcula]|uniref:Phage gp6-like head-tail connector protein n=1 Tax=Paracoccus methylarcula TaxID=72022 RepID=A0A422QSL6_9RHOB|nr:head-tail connector protein [Paracoccus methylarcula]RNF32946.1 phage gp6-like head-tail connector protein [Paracoccus methylarcula]
MGLIPRCTVPPVGDVVTLAEMKGHLRELDNFEDGLIQQAINDAVAHLDGWRGILGRCILEQTWEVDIPCAGTFRLPLPDVIDATSADATVTLSRDGLGSLVTVDATATVSFRAKMPDELMPVVQRCVKLLAAHWMENRLAASGDDIRATPLAVDAMIGPIRWTRI